MSALGARGLIATLVLGLALGAWAAWAWQANRYGQQLAAQAEANQREREQAAVAVIDWQDRQQVERRALEDRLQVNDETHYKELRNAQTNQARLRDRLATADMRLSVLLAAPGGGVGCQPLPAPAAWIMERREPNLPQRLLNELSPSPATVPRTDRPGGLPGLRQRGDCPEVKEAAGLVASTSRPAAVPADCPCKSSQGFCFVHKAKRAYHLSIHTVRVLLFMSSPIIPWMGGKRRLADRLIPLFPPHECYVEVFAGGATLYFMRPQAAPVEVLNDINGDLVTLYRVVQNHLEEFVRQFKWALSSRQVFEWQKMTRPETLTDIQRAARFFYLQHHAFAGKITSQSFGTATTAPAINLLRIEENLSAAWQRLSGTYVENLSWLECAERYDRAHTFHYMDPPYWQTAGYGVDFPFENYERMADFMRRCKGKVMVSINDHPDIRRVFEGFHFETLDIRYSTTNQRQGKPDVTGELVIMNWQPVLLGWLF